MIGNMGNMMKKVQKMQADMEAAQQKLELMEIEGRSGGGLISITANGKGVVQSVKVDPSLLKPQEVDVLEDLLLAALLDTRAKAEAMEAEMLGNVTQGLKLPAGMKLPF